MSDLPSPTQQPLAVRVALQPRPVQRLICDCRPIGNGKWVGFARKDTRKGRNYKAWRKQLVQLVHSVWRERPPLNGPLRASLTLVLPRPKTRPTVPLNTTKKTGGVTRKVPNPRRIGGHWVVTKEAWATGSRVLCPAKPDVDRLTNAVYDVLTEVGVWYDDAQVAIENNSKWYAAKGEEPSVEIRVEPV